MCVGVPMVLVSSNGVSATVEREGHRHEVCDLLDDGPRPTVGSVVLVHLGVVVRVLDAQEAVVREAEVSELPVPDPDPAEDIEVTEVAP